LQLRGVACKARRQRLLIRDGPTVSSQRSSHGIASICFGQPCSKRVGVVALTRRMSFLCSRCRCNRHDDLENSSCPALTGRPCSRAGHQNTCYHTSMPQGSAGRMDGNGSLAHEAATRTRGESLGAMSMRGCASALWLRGRVNDASLLEGDWPLGAEASSAAAALGWSSKSPPVQLGIPMHATSRQWSVECAAAHSGTFCCPWRPGRLLSDVPHIRRMQQRDFGCAAWRCQS
jgi:hypothetical protein